MFSDEFNLAVDDSQLACMHVNCESLHNIIEIKHDLKMMIMVMMMTKRKAFLRV